MVASLQSLRRVAPTCALLLLYCSTVHPFQHQHAVGDCFPAHLRGGSSTPPSEQAASSSESDPARVASKNRESLATIDKGLQTISLKSPPGRGASPSRAAESASRASPRNPKEAHSAASPKSSKTQSVFQRLYQSSQQREQNLAKLRQQQEEKEAKEISPPRSTKYAGGGDVFKRLSTTGTAARPIHVPLTNRTRSGSRPKPIDWGKVGTKASRGEASPPKPKGPKSVAETAMMGLDYRELMEHCKLLQARVKQLESAEEEAKAEAQHARDELQVMQGRYTQLNTLLDEMSTALEDALDRMRDLQERFPWIAYVGGKGSEIPPGPHQQREKP